jgi:hypothetical protein
LAAQLHLWLAVACALLVTAAGVEALWRMVRRAPPAVLAQRIDQSVLLALVITSAGGLGVVSAGGGPANSLHYVYTVVALGLLPLASTFTRGRSDRVRAGATLIAAIVALVVVLRLFQTG